MKNYNPERRAWKGRSYRKGGERVRNLKEAELRGVCPVCADGACETKSFECGK